MWGKISLVNIINSQPINILVDRLRDTSVKNEQFKETVHSISTFMFYEFAKKANTIDEEILLWSGDNYTAKEIDTSNIAIVPIMRAGMGMEPGLTTFYGGCPIYHLGMARDEKTYKPSVSLNKLPKILERTHIFLLDIMLATGGSMDEAIKIIKEKGAEQITAFSIIAAPEGARRINKNHPDVQINIAVMDDGLDKNKYIRPGIGDAGDLYYNTNE